MKRQLLCLGLFLSVIVAGASYGFPEPEGASWGEWRFTDGFDNAGETSADKSSAAASLVRRNPATSAISVAGGVVVFTQTGPDDYLRVDVDDLVENGGGSYVNEYTMIFDVKTTDADWFPIYNTGYDNYNDAELWVDADGAIGSGSYSDPGVIPLDVWVRLVVVRQLEGSSWVRDIYVDGVLVFDNLGSEGIDGNASLYTNAQQGEGQFTILSDNDGTAYAGGQLDNFAFVAAAMSALEIADLGKYDRHGIFGVDTLASVPQPEDEALDIPRDMDLSWTPVATAQTRDVYFGIDWADVNNASPAAPLDVLASPGQGVTTYDPGRLDFGQTYYWRIDEVNGAPDFTAFKGNVWSFTVEPLAYPITGVVATASSAHGDDYAPSKTVDGSGLNAADQHGTAGTDSWLSDGAQPLPAWIQYEFDGLYKLHEMWVWNSNQPIEAFVGFGAKDVTVEYSTDGLDWTVLEGATQFAQGPGNTTYAHNTTVAFGGAMARFVKITIGDNWGQLAQTGLSEVRFLYTPIQAREPQPASGQADVALDTVLSWRAGREAGTHEVYFSDDQAAVIDGTALLDTVSENQVQPGGLEYGKTYYWKITEVNEAASPTAAEGDVWSFSTIRYFAIDDMESYDDDLDGGTAIFQTWIDGWDNGTGATVGYIQSPFAEQTIVNSGDQSMPFDYNNVNSPFYSETERTWDSPQNWTGDGVTHLTVNFRGNAVGFVETASGGILMGGAGADIWDVADEFRYAYKRLSGDGSLVAKVESLVQTDVWAKAGVMIRESLDAGSKHAFVAVTPAQSISFQRRLITGDVSSNTDAAAGLVAPYWVKITRSGNTFTGQRSEDGVTWRPMTDDAAASSVTIEMIGNVYIGLAVTSHASGVSTTAEFANVATTGNVTGAWQAEAIGVAQPANDAAPLYVAVEDSAGHLEVVTHPDANATVLTDWQEWNIPLGTFSDAGVNMTKVTRMIIGVGDRDNPTPDGAGLLYIDDIRASHPVPAE